MLHVNNLPLGSAFVAETRGGYQFVGWDQDRYMTAGLIDSIRVLQHILILCNVDPKKKKPDPPEPYPLPDHLEREKVVDPGSFGSMLIKAKQAKAARQEAGSDGGGGSGGQGSWTDQRTLPPEHRQIPSRPAKTARRNRERNQVQSPDRPGYGRVP